MKQGKEVAEERARIRTVHSAFYDVSDAVCGDEDDKNAFLPRRLALRGSTARSL